MPAFSRSREPLSHCRPCTGRGSCRTTARRREHRGREANKIAAQPRPSLTLRRGSAVFEAGVAGGTELLNLPQRPTAIVAATDEIAAGVVEAARVKALRVPEDLSVDCPKEDIRFRQALRCSRTPDSQPMPAARGPHSGWRLSRRRRAPATRLGPGGSRLRGQRRDGRGRYDVPAQPRCAAI